MSKFIERAVQQTSNEMSVLESIQLYSIENAFPVSEIEHLGLVTGIGHSWFGTSRSRISTAESNAIFNLQFKARKLDADAVIGVKFTGAGVKGFWGITPWSNTAMIHVSGTAIKFRTKP